MNPSDSSRTCNLATSTWDQTIIPAQAMAAAESGVLHATTGHECRIPTVWLDRARVGSVANETEATAGEADLTAFRELFWSSVSLESLVQGNITKPAAVTMVEDILAHHSAQKWNKTTDKQTAFRASTPSQPITQIPANTAVVLRQVPDNVEENNSCVEVYFQFGAWNLDDVTRLDLLEQVIGEPFFDDLRTKQQVRYSSFISLLCNNLCDIFRFLYKQLGYSVSCGVRQTYGTLGFCFQVQSSKFPVHEITKAILTFVSEIPAKIAGLDAGQYLVQVNALRGNRLTPPQSLSEAARAHWSEIEDAHYCFFSAKKQAALLEDARLSAQSALQQFSQKLFLGEPKVLVVQATRESLEEKENLASLRCEKTISVVCDTIDACAIHALFPATL